ncbi:hypothetical protein K523DRAFT_228843, partial [Schizophyllum commune Tattone D]
LQPTSAPLTQPPPTTMCCTAHTQHSSTPASAKATPGDAAAPTNASAPQCCHCGWRGAHAPDCPFK